jgi:hypothetical protein
LLLFLFPVSRCRPGRPPLPVPLCPFSHIKTLTYTIRPFFFMTVTVPITVTHASLAGSFMSWLLFSISSSFGSSFPFLPPHQKRVLSAPLLSAGVAPLSLSLGPRRVVSKMFCPSHLLLLLPSTRSYTLRQKKQPKKTLHIRRVGCYLSFSLFSPLCLHFRPSQSTRLRVLPHAPPSEPAPPPPHPRAHTYQRRDRAKRGGNGGTRQRAPTRPPARFHHLTRRGRRRGRRSCLA